MPLSSGAITASFRGAAQGKRLKESFRRNVVSKHDASIRFTNSTISALKPSVGSEESLFVVQPAVRLRNLDHYWATGAMSGFGCSFTAFGALLPGDQLRQAIQLTLRFLETLSQSFEHQHGGRALSYEVRGDPSDTDLLAAAEASGWRTVVDPSRPAAFRHRFGIDGVSGRNVNVEVDAGHGAVEVGNIILMERDGQPVGIDVAFGTPMFLVAATGTSHPVLTSSLACTLGDRDLMFLDALETAAVLCLDGMRPAARGRSGRYRRLLQIATQRHAGSHAELLEDARTAVILVDAERRQASPLHPGDSERTAEQAIDAVVAHLTRLAPIAQQ